MDLTKLMREMLELYQYVAENNNIVVSLDCAEGVCIAAELNRMRQVVANLLDNTIKHSRPAGGWWSVFDGQEIRRSFRFGIQAFGIPAEELPNIWDRLYRGDKSGHSLDMGGV